MDNLPEWAHLVPLPDPEKEREHYEFVKARPRKIIVDVDQVYPLVLAELEEAGIKDKGEELTQYWLAVCRNFVVWDIQLLTEGEMVELKLTGDKDKWAWSNYLAGSAKFEQNKFRRFEGAIAAMQGREARVYYRRLRKTFPAAQVQ